LSRSVAHSAFRLRKRWPNSGQRWVRSYGGSPEFQAHAREDWRRLQAAAISDPDSAIAVARGHDVVNADLATREQKPSAEEWEQPLHLQARVLVNRWYLEQLRIDWTHILPRIGVPVLAPGFGLDTTSPPEIGFAVPWCARRLPPLDGEPDDSTSHARSRTANPDEPRTASRMRSRSKASGTP
jgi:hypothetical protein